MRTDPVDNGDEPTQLIGFLDYQRDTLRTKVEGLSREQLAATHAPASMTLGGMVKHLAFVEHWWLQCIFLGREFGEPWASVDWDADEDWDWHSAVDDQPEEVLALLASEIAASDSVIRAATVDTLSVRASRRTGQLFNLRWVLLHLIEEYARHNGHADLIRESIDGVTGE